METNYIWHNWKFIEWNESLQHTVNHALHYWTWAFEWIRLYDTKIWPRAFRLTDHIKRLFYSADVLGLEVGYSVDEVCQIINNLISKNWIYNWYIRPIIWHWYWKMWLNPSWANTDFVISLWNWWKYLENASVKVKISNFIRPHPSSLVIDAKLSWYYINSYFANNEAKNLWYDEALLLDYKWNIAEWPWENIFFIKWDKLITPNLCSILPWITRDTVLKYISKEFNLEPVEFDIKPSDLSWFEEAFFVGTAAEVTPIAKIDDLDWNSINYKTMFWSKIANYYKDLVSWYIEKYKFLLY